MFDSNCLTLVIAYLLYWFFIFSMDYPFFSVTFFLYRKRINFPLCNIYIPFHSITCLDFKNTKLLVVNQSSFFFFWLAFENTILPLKSSKYYFLVVLFKSGAITNTIQILSDFDNVRKLQQLLSEL